MEKHLRFFIIGLLFFILPMGQKGMPFKNAYGLDISEGPTAYLVDKARGKRLILIGTHHRNAHIHDVITAALPLLVKDAQVRTLFVEIPTSQQQIINQFRQGALKVGDIRVCNIVDSPSYREILKQARALGMAIIAIDTEVPSPVSRDEWMAKQVTSYLQEHPEDKAIVVVGARHVLKDVMWACTQAPSLADYLKGYDIFSIVPWTDAEDTPLPVAMDITPVRFGGVKMPLLNSMNIRPDVSIATVADGIILLPKVR